MNTESLTTEQLIEQAPPGVHLTRNRLGIWAREGLVQRPHRKGRGKGVGGPINLYPPETLERIQAVAELLGGRRDIEFRELRFGLWLRGETVPWERVRSDILALTKSATRSQHEFRAKTQQSPEAAEDELDRAAWRMARVSGFDRLPFFENTALRSRPQRLTFFLTTLKLAADGRLPLAWEDEKQGEDEIGAVIASTLNPLSSELSAEERAASLRQLDSYGGFNSEQALKAFEDATAEEAEQIRHHLIEDLGGALGIDALRTIPHWLELAAGLFIGVLHGERLARQTSAGTI